MKRRPPIRLKGQCYGGHLFTWNTYILNLVTLNDRDDSIYAIIKFIIEINTGKEVIV